MSNLNEMTIPEIEAYFLKKRKEFNELDRSKLTINQVWGWERYIDDLYFEVYERKMQFEDGRKEGYDEGIKEAQAMVNSILKELKAGNSINETSEKHQVEVAYTERIAKIIKQSSQ
jgi:hypothetical protein